MKLNGQTVVGLFVHLVDTKSEACGLIIALFQSGSDSKRVDCELCYCMHFVTP